MISEKTVELLDGVLHIAGNFHFFPLSFNKEACRLWEVRNDGPFSITIWRMLGWCSIIIQTFLIVLIIFIIITHPIPPMHEIVVLVSFQIMCCLTILVIYNHLTRAHGVEVLLNRFFIFDETFRTYRKSVTLSK